MPVSAPERGLEDDVGAGPHRFDRVAHSPGDALVGRHFGDLAPLGPQALQEARLVLQAAALH
jgi:hypothetical protein